MTESEALTVTRVRAGELRELRRRVLRSNDPTASVDDERDGLDDSVHIAAFRGSQLVGGGSFFTAAAPVNVSVPSVQLRYLAVEPDHQGRDVGSAVMLAAETVLASRGVVQIWANGRDSALGFYRSQGWSVVPGSEHVSTETGLPHTVIFKVLRRDDPFEVGWATPSDADSLARIRADMHLSLSLTVVNNGWVEMAADYFRTSLANGTDIATVARLGDGSVVSAAVASFRTVPPSPRFPRGHVAYLHSVGTLPAFRRRGASRKVVTLLVDELRRRCVERVELHATDQGEPIYVELGFERHLRPELRLAISDPVPEGSAEIGGDVPRARHE